MCRFHSKIFIVRSISAVRPFSGNNLRGRNHTISGYDMLLLKFSATEDRLMAEIGLTMENISLWHWDIIRPQSPTKLDLNYKISILQKKILKLGFSNFPLSPTQSPKCRQIYNTPTNTSLHHFLEVP